jgi:antitoxin PrlF
MMESKVTSKGQITLPKEARDQLNIKPGDKVRIFIDPYGHLAILPVIPVSALRGLLKSKRRRPPTIEEMDEAIREGVAERYRRAVGK